MRLKWHTKEGEVKKYPKTIFEDRDFLQEKINILTEENQSLKELLKRRVK